MDVMKLFEEYLPRWSNEKHLPIPTTQHMDRWIIAWNDFMNEELPKHYNERRDDYLSMRIKTKEDTIRELGQQEEIEINQQLEQEQKEEKPLSGWEKVKRLLDK